MKIFNILKINLFLTLFRKAYPVWYTICFIKIALLHILPVIKAQFLMKAVPNKLISLGLGQARPVRSAHGEHIATSQRKTWARSQWSSSERTPRAPWGHPEASEHDGVSCHTGEALISNTLFGVKEMAMLSPVSTSDALHVVFVWEVVLVWWCCGNCAGRRECTIGYWLL